MWLLFHWEGLGLMKRILSMVIICILLPIHITCFAANNICIILDGKLLTFSEAPYIEQGTTMVPMRAVFEALGAEAQYDSQTKKITATKDGINIELWIGASVVNMNGISKQLPVVVMNKNGSTMVPLRFVSESLGATVDWNSNERTITIQSNGNRNQIQIILNGQPLYFNEAPYIEQGTTMVPMRAVFEALGAEVQYDSQTKMITAIKDGINIELWIGASIASVNGISEQLPVVVTNKNESAMVPLRFVSESLGASIDWNDDARIITIKQENDFIEDTLEEDDFVEDDFTEDTLEEDAFVEDDFTEDTLEEDDFVEDDFTEDTLEEDDFAEDDFTEDALEEDEFTEDDFENYEDIYADDPNRDYSVILVAYNPGTIRKIYWCRRT